MLRKLLLLALVLSAVAGIAACGDEATDETTPASTPAATTPASTPASTPTQAADDPATLFTENCAGCHGADGSGGNGPDLRGEDNVDGIAEQVRNGGGGMPSYSGELTDAQIEALAEYVASEL
jgi:cytochrome c551